MRAKAEWSKLNEIMIHRPSVEVEYAMLAPKPFLFERVFNVQRAIMEHEKLEEIMVENGVKVKRFENEIIRKANEFEPFRKMFMEFFLSKVHFYGKIDDSHEAEENFRKNIELLDNKTIFDLMVLEPSIILKNNGDGFIEYPSVYSNLPLANLYFMRDQQAVADNGVIIGNMKMEQRKREIDITRLVIEQVFGVKDAFEINRKGHFEGGDFMPAGSFSLIGVGSRTDWEGAYQAIFSGKIDSEEILVVENPIYEFAKGNKMMNMHLDTYFNIAGNGIAITSVYLAKMAKGVIFRKESRGNYVKEGHTNLYDYMKSKDFNFIDLSIPEQLSYSSNFLTLNDKKIITVNVKSVIEKLINEKAFDNQTEEIVLTELSKLGNNIFPNRPDVKREGIEFINADLIELTGGYGGAHCMTATLERA
ncbi:MAG: arginine deiminase family protein [Thermoplasmata archaeon]